MRFTRRRWDAWCLGGAAFLAAGGATDAAFLSGDPWRIPAFALPMLALLPLRFRIPSGGFEATPVRRMSAGRRLFIVWVIVSLPLFLVAAILVPRRLDPWWIWLLAGAAHLTVTLVLARRADSPSIPDA